MLFVVEKTAMNLSRGKQAASSNDLMKDPLASGFLAKTVSNEHLFATHSLVSRYQSPSD